MIDYISNNWYSKALDETFDVMIYLSNRGQYCSARHLFQVTISVYRSLKYKYSKNS